MEGQTLLKIKKKGLEVWKQTYHMNSKAKHSYQRRLTLVQEIKNDIHNKCAIIQDYLTSMVMHNNISAEIEKNKKELERQCMIIKAVMSTYSLVLRGSGFSNLAEIRV